MRQALINWDSEKVVIYTRVSTDGQEQSGLGIEAQLDLCRRYAQLTNKTIIAEFTETISGHTLLYDRTEFNLAIACCNAHNAVLVVAKLDRLSRRMSDALRFIEKEIYNGKTPPLTIAENPNMSDLELKVKLMLADEERQEISRRTKAALRVLKNEGVELGKAGRTSAHNKAREATREAIEMAIELREKGKGYYTIAECLNAQGFKTSRGGVWYASSIRSRLATIQSGESGKICQA
jgi:DNA invertase Pin-like site-specific DNA recombinase